jgi:hypothetical protein
VLYTLPSIPPAALHLCDVNSVAHRKPAIAVTVDVFYWPNSDLEAVRYVAELFCNKTLQIVKLMVSDIYLVSDI